MLINLIIIIIIKLDSPICFCTQYVMKDHLKCGKKIWSHTDIEKDRKGKQRSVSTPFPNISGSSLVTTLKVYSNRF